MRRRALEREVDKLRLKLDGKRAVCRRSRPSPLVPDAQPRTCVGLHERRSCRGHSEQLDRTNAIKLLARAAAAAVIAAATYVTQHPPDAPPSGDDAKAAARVRPSPFTTALRTFGCASRSHAAPA
jgi:hypothetical protein